eukprot:6062551-Prymnesium_polylepis.1
MLTHACRRFRRTRGRKPTGDGVSTVNCRGLERAQPEGVGGWVLVCVWGGAPRHRERRAYGRGSRGSAVSGSASATLARHSSRVRRLCLLVAHVGVGCARVCVCVTGRRCVVDGARVLRALTC